MEKDVLKTKLDKNNSNDGQKQLFTSILTLIILVGTMPSPILASVSQNLSITLDDPTSAEAFSGPDFTVTLANATVNINCTLWGNWTTWEEKTTQNGSSLGNGTHQLQTLDNEGLFHNKLYTWGVKCVDATNVSDYKMSANETFIYNQTMMPQELRVSLEKPLNESQVNDSTEFKFNVLGNPTSNYTCEIYFNSSLKETMNNILEGQNKTFTVGTYNLSDGLQDWKLNCSESLNSSMWNISKTKYVNYTSIPPLAPQMLSVSLIGPSDLGVWDGTNDFQFTVGSNQNVNCSLAVGNTSWTDTYAETNLSNGPNTFVYNYTLLLNNSEYLWNVSCVDYINSSLNNVSINRNFTWDDGSSGPAPGPSSENGNYTYLWSHAQAANFFTEDISMFDFSGAPYVTRGFGCSLENGEYDNENTSMIGYNCCNDKNCGTDGEDSYDMDAVYVDESGDYIAWNIIGAFMKSDNLSVCDGNNNSVAFVIEFDIDDNYTGSSANTGCTEVGHPTINDQCYPGADYQIWFFPDENTTLLAFYNGSNNNSRGEPTGDQQYNISFAANTTATNNYVSVYYNCSAYKDNPEDFSQNGLKIIVNKSAFGVSGNNPQLNFETNTFNFTAKEANPIDMLSDNGADPYLFMGPEEDFGACFQFDDDQTGCENSSDEFICQWTSFGGGNGLCNPDFNNFQEGDACFTYSNSTSCTSDNSGNCEWVDTVTLPNRSVGGICMEQFNPNKFGGGDCDDDCFFCFSENQCLNSDANGGSDFGGCEWYNDSFNTQGWCDVINLKFGCDKVPNDCFTESECTTAGWHWNATWHTCVETPSTEICFNGVDDNANGQIDCEETYCEDNSPSCGSEINTLIGDFQGMSPDDALRYDLIGNNPNIINLREDSSTDSLNESNSTEILELEVAVTDKGIGVGIVIEDSSDLYTCGGAEKDRKYLFYVDNDANSSTGCNVVVDGAMQNGFEYVVKYGNFSWINNTENNTNQLWACHENKWILRDAPVLPMMVMDFDQTEEELVYITSPGECQEELGGVGYPVVTILDKANIGNPTEDMRFSVMVSNGDWDNLSNVTTYDSLLDAYYTPGSVGVEPVNCFENPSQCGTEFMLLGGGEYMPFEDCIAPGDEDADGLVNCDDLDCIMLPQCSGFYNVSADHTAPTITMNNVDSFYDVAFVRWTTDEPTNGSVKFYNNDSFCTTINATIYDLGIPDFADDDFKPWHGIGLDDFSLGNFLSANETYFYKIYSLDQANNTASTSCLNFTTADSIENVSMLFEFNATGGEGFLTNLSIDVNGEPLIIGGTESFNSSNNNVNITFSNPNANQSNNWSITLVGSDLSQASNFDFDDSFLGNESGEEDDFIGIKNDEWLKLVQRFGADYVEMIVPNTGDTLYHCLDNGTSCTDVTNISGVELLNQTANFSKWRVPTTLGFSTYSSGIGVNQTNYTLSFTNLTSSTLNALVDVNNSLIINITNNDNFSRTYNFSIDSPLNTQGWLNGTVNGVTIPSNTSVFYNLTIVANTSGLYSFDVLGTLSTNASVVLNSSDDITISLNVSVVDVVAPVISGVLNESVTNGSVRFTWVTDESSNSSVVYGSTLALVDGLNVSSSFVTSHVLNVSGLSSSTLYYFNVSSCDVLGNCNTSGPFNFTTLSNPVVSVFDVNVSVNQSSLDVFVDVNGSFLLTVFNNGSVDGVLYDLVLDNVNGSSVGVLNVSNVTLDSGFGTDVLLTVGSNVSGLFDFTVFVSQANDSGVNVTSDLVSLNVSVPLSYTPITQCQDIDSNNTDYVLQNDLTSLADWKGNYSWGCFWVPARNVTIDCDGYSIIGNGTASAFSITGLTENITIKNCVIQNVTKAIIATSATDINISNNTITDYTGSEAVMLTNVNNSIIDSNSLDIEFEQKDGIVLTKSHNNNITNNFFDNLNGTNYTKAALFIGWDTGSANNNLISNNEFTKINVGMRINNGSSNNINKNNFENASGRDVIILTGSMYNLFTENNFTSNLSVQDNGFKNNWNSSSAGNTWLEYNGKDDYGETDTCEDANMDRLCDLPYYLDGTANATDNFARFTGTYNGSVYNIVVLKTANQSSTYLDYGVTYTINVTNQGVENLTEISVIDEYNTSELNFENASGNYLSNTTVSLETGEVEWLINLTVGETKLFYLNFTTLLDGNISNDVFVENDTLSFADDLEEIGVEENVSFAIVKTLLSTVTEGNAAQFLINITNTGLSDAIGYYVIDEFEVSYLNYTTSSVAIDLVNYSLGEVEWLVNVSAGNNKEIYVNFTTLTSGNTTNIVTIEDDEELFYENDSVTLEIQINDSTAPVVTLISPANGNYLGVGLVTLTANATDNYDIANCTFNLYNSVETLLNTSTNTTITEGLQTYIASISDGLYYWNVTCVDNIGSNRGNSSTWNFTKDTINPVVTPTAPADNLLSNNTDVTFSINVVDANSVDCTLYLDGVANQTQLEANGATSFGSITLTEGTHNWTANCTDQSGNSALSTIRNLEIDTTSPVTTAYYAGTTGLDGWYTTDVVINFSFVEANTVNQTTYSINGTWTNLSGNNFTVSTEANNTFLYYSVDNVENIESTHTTYVAIDKTNPSIINFSVNPLNGSNVASNNNVTITVNITETNADIYSFYVNGSFVENRSYTGGIEEIFNWTSASNFVERNVTFRIIAYDDSGRSTTSDELTLFVTDSNGPTVTLLTPNSGSIVSETTQTFTYNVTDSNSLNNCTINIYNSSNVLVNNSIDTSVSNGEQTYSYDFTNDDDGLYYWNATCYDGSANVGISSTNNLTLDTTDPVIVVSNSGTQNDDWWSTNVEVTLSVTDENANLSSLKYKKLATETWTTYSSPFNMSKTATLYYTVNDLAGQTTNSSTLYSIDKYSPTTTLYYNGTKNGEYYTSNVRVSLAAEETEIYGQSGINHTNYSVNAGGIQIYNSTLGYFTVSTEGSNQVLVYSIDNAGNLETSHNVTINIDKTSPDLTVDSPTDGSRVGGTQTITVSSTANDIQSIAWYINNSLIETNYTNANEYNFTWNTLGYLDAEYEHKFLITDLAGLENFTTVNYTVDNTIPVVVVTTPTTSQKKNSVPINVTGTVTSDVDVVSVKLNNGSYAAATISGTNWNYTLTTANQGINTVYVRANDSLGYESTVVERTFDYDNVSPVITSIEISPSPANNETSTFAITAYVTEANQITTIRSKLEGGTYTSLNGSAGKYTGTLTNTLSSEGTYNVEVNIIDDFTNSLTENATTVEINNTIPSIAYNVANASIVANGSTITITVAGEDTANYNVSVNDTNVVANTAITGSFATYTFNANEGDNVTVYSFANSSSSIDTTKESIFFVDATAPVIAENALPTYTTIASVNVTGTVTDNNMRSVLINNVSASLNASGFFAKEMSLTKGANTFSIIAYDQAGQTDTEEVSIFYDSTAPSISSSVTGTAGSNGWYVSNATILLTAEDGTGSGAWTQVYNGTAWVNQSTVIATEGTTTTTYRGIDYAGNIAENKTVVVKVDTLSPVVTSSLRSSPLTPEKDVNEVLFLLAATGGTRATITVLGSTNISDNMSVNSSHYYYTAPAFSEVEVYDAVATVYDAAGNYQVSSYNLSVIEQVLVDNIESEGNETIAINETSSVNVTLDLELNDSVDSGEINITLGYETPVNETLNDSLKFLTFEEDSSINNSLLWVLIKMFYTNEEISGLLESNLSMYWFNESNSTWIELHSGLGFVNSTGVNETANYVWAKVNHFSTYSASGSRIICSDNSAVPTSTGCYYDDVSYNNGYICDGVWQSSSCSSGSKTVEETTHSSTGGGSDIFFDYGETDNSIVSATDNNSLNESDNITDKDNLTVEETGEVDDGQTVETPLDESENDLQAKGSDKTDLISEENAFSSTIKSVAMVFLLLILIAIIMTLYILRKKDDPLTSNINETEK